MSQHESIHHGCTHCSCNSPILKTLEQDLFSPSQIAKLSENRDLAIAPESESLVIHGGTIRPLINGKMDTVEAIGIHDGKVVAVGTLQSVTDTMNSNGITHKTKKLKKQQTLLPGLIEPHVHIVPSALTGSWLDLGPYKGQDLRKVYDKTWLSKQIKVYIKKHQTKLSIGSWILGCGVDPALMPFQKSDVPGGLNQLITFDCDYLDTIVRDYPLFMTSASMHTAYVNTKALKIVYEKNEAALKPTYPTFEDYKAKTNGQLQEEVGIAPALKSIPSFQIAEAALSIFRNLNEQFETAVSRGITFMYDAGMNALQKTILETYLTFHQRKVRIGAAQTITSKEIDSLATYVPVQNYEDVYYGSIKIISDGSNQGLTGYQSEKYCCNPDNNYGAFNFPESDPHPKELPDDYRTLVKRVVSEKEWPLMIHANGDIAVAYAIEVYRDAFKDASDKKKVITDRMHRIEHCSILTDDQIKDMKDLGIVPSFLIGHVGYWGYAFREAIFEDKAEKLDLCKSALNAGLRITLHTDHSVSPLGPLRLMEQSITRIMEGSPASYPDNVLNPKERLTVEEALLAVTYDAAWQCHADKWVGSLQEGYFADFVILEEDPLLLNIAYKKLRNIPVLETWKGGTSVYKKTKKAAMAF